MRAALRNEGEAAMARAPRAEVFLPIGGRGAPPIGPPRADSGVVHEDVELGSEMWEIFCEGRDAVTICDVQLVIEHILAFGIQLATRCGSFPLVATRQDDAEPFLAKLDAGLKAQAAIRAGHEGYWAIGGRGPHGPTDQDGCFCGFVPAGRQGAARAGRIFWLEWNRLPGSYFPFRAASRSYFAP